MLGAVVPWDKCQIGHGYDVLLDNGRHVRFTFDDIIVEKGVDSPLIVGQQWHNTNDGFKEAMLYIPIDSAIKIRQWFP